ncbi:phosphoethanolamine n-phosphodiesterase [Grosmannia clavigera kw1407]|uniref:Phosphoethanolamine n-phosphodiesterase n=1 Tax=Grosmannia clavigera (strain kw1407 / UAMH 11150) TaxID=655863 RepID=F0XUA4_GROCL|nr:phosphoethanolamine n-phosphodiesterase [Grosmannia clavigera kw1407]EFW99030.1 phosphoethanolamine n-phosphodiesterase [Grosmannia clavigera kw1407]
MTSPPQRQKKPGPSEYKAIAAQFAAAKRAKEINDALRAQKDVRPEQAAASAMEKHRIALEQRRKAAYERRWLWTVGFWLWLLVIHATGILYFTSGFLLTRLVLDEKSSCAVSPLQATQGNTAAVPPSAAATDGCWHPKTFDRVVIILIDALRYDFTVPVNDSAVFHNAFPFLYETAVAQPSNAFLRPFIADPPTATLQRLKGLTTGTLPTFVDIGSNFAGTAIEEDNLLAQLRTVDKKIAHLGDDTWTALFPGYFEANISHAYDSFNVRDLHTVDNGVMEHIFPLLEAGSRRSKKTSPWDLLIGHCLGVDHAGHRYGPAHTAMREKLQQMDEFVRRVAGSIDDDTLLVVMGDHGMDSKGDHGGESDDEVEAALWMYARQPVFGRTEAAFVMPPLTAKERPVNQIDLVPTLALLMGIPIPYNNLGFPIEEAFIGGAGNDWANLATVAEITAAGIHRYQSSLSASNILTPPVVSRPGRGVSAVSEQEAMAEAFAALSEYQVATLRICKDLWARFDVGSMVFGIAISAAGVAILLLYASRSVEDGNEDEDIAVVEDATLDQAEAMLEMQGELIPATRRGSGKDAATQAERDEARALQQQQELHRSLVLAAVMAGVPTFAASAALTIVGSQPWYSGAGYAAMASIGAVAARLLGVGRRSVSRLLPSSIWGWMAVVFTGAQSVGFASNSYTVWEDSILLFFLATFGLVAALQATRLATSGERVLGVYHAVVFVLLGRVASLSKLCREEQMPYCSTTYYGSASSSTSAPWQLGILFAVFLVLPSVVRSFYEPTRSYEGLAPVWIGVVFRGGLLMAALHWTLDGVERGGWLRTLVPESMLTATMAKTASVYLAQTVLGLALVAGTAAFAWAGPCISVTAIARPGTNQAQVAVLGYANAHGARYLLLVTNVLMAAVQVSMPMGGGALSLMLWQVLSLVELLELLRTGAKREGGGGEETTDETTDEAAAMDPSAGSTMGSSVAVIGPVVLAMLANLHYFATGHQATLSSIQWDSAFVALTTLRYPWSPLLVVANTAAAHLLAVAAVPLLVLWKTSPRRRGGLLSPTSRALAGFAAYFAVEALATMVWAAHLRRHLMLYRVFSPRFMLAAGLLLLVDVAGLVLALPGLRSNTMAVSDVFGWLDEY